MVSCLTYLTPTQSFDEHKVHFQNLTSHLGDSGIKNNPRTKRAQGTAREKNAKAQNLCRCKLVVVVVAN